MKSENKSVVHNDGMKIINFAVGGHRLSELLIPIVISLSEFVHKIMQIAWALWTTRGGRLPVEEEGRLHSDLYSARFTTKALLMTRPPTMDSAMDSPPLQD